MPRIIDTDIETLGATESIDGGLSPHPMRLLKYLLGFALRRYSVWAATLSMLAAAGCGPKPNGLPVEYVVPDGYHGTFSVTLSTTAGQTAPTTNGHFVVTIPADGKLSVSSFDFVEGKHLISARNESSPDLLPPSNSPGSISLRFVDYNVDTITVIWIIGTQQEADDASKKLSGIH